MLRSAMRVTVVGNSPCPFLTSSHRMSSWTCWAMSLYSRKLYNVDNGEVAEPETDSKMVMSGTSLVVQWLRLCVPNVGDLSSSPGQGIGSHMWQWGSKIPRAAAKTWHSLTDMYTLPCVKQIPGQKLLCNTGSPAWLSCDDLEGWDGRRGQRLKREVIYIIVADLHCCMVETTTTL